MQGLATIKGINLNQLGQHGFSRDDAELLQKIARSLSRIDENSCNISYSDAEQERIDKRETRLENQAAELANEYGYKVYRQTDPRGWSLYIYKETDLDSYPIDSCYSSRAFAVCSQ